MDQNMTNAERNEQTNLEKELALFKDGVQPDQRRIQIYAEESLTLRKKLREAQTALAQAKAEADTLRTDIQEQQAELFRVNGDMRQVQEQSEIYRDELRQSKEKANAISQQAGRYQQALAQAKAEADTLRTDIQERQAELVRVNGDMRQLQGQCDIYRDELRQSKEKTDELSQQVGRYQLALEQMKAEIARLTEENKRYFGFDGYGPVNWATFLIPIWRRYYYENYAEIETKMDRLKTTLDKASCDTVELLCKRNFELLPAKSDADKFLYKYSAFYTPWEANGLNDTEHKRIFKERHLVPEKCYLETTVSKFYNGLKLLPEAVQMRIQGSHVIDGGSYWGDSMLAFSEYEPAQIHCFEPDRDNFNLLQEVVQNNGLSVCTTLNHLGLSSHNHLAKIYEHAEQPSCTSILAADDDTGEKETVELVTLDHYVQENNIKVGLIKLDVEGVEYDVIEGAKETICRDKPILLISVYHTPKDFFEIKPMIESWGLGYRFMIRKTTYRDLIAEVMLIGYTEKE